MTRWRRDSFDRRDEDPYRRDVHGGRNDDYRGFDDRRRDDGYALAFSLASVFVSTECPVQLLGHDIVVIVGSDTATDALIIQFTEAT